MERFFAAVVRHKKLVVFLFVLATIASVLCIPRVSVNYDFSDYLPADSPSTVSLRTMYDAFDSDVPNGRLYVDSLSLVQAESLAKDLLAIDGVDAVMWLGDTVDIRVPLEVASADTVASWYVPDADGYLYQLTINETNANGAVQIMNEIRAVGEAASGQSVALAGDAINTATAQGSSNTEIQLILLMAAIVIFGLLFLTSESWFEPVLFLSAIGVSIVINLGTNIFRGEISFITQMCGAILQLAVTMDYGIVILHSFRGFKAKGFAPELAMTKAMTKAVSVIASSAATTFFGFLSLIVMSFLIGQDMGIVLAKGVFLSFVSIMFLLPALILMCQKPLDRLGHRNFLPSFEKFANVCMKLAVPVSVLISLLIVPAFLGQGKVSYTYGASGFNEEGSQLYEETQLIDGYFGANEQWVVLVPDGQWAQEEALIEDLEALPLVSQVNAYSTIASAEIPTAMVNDEELSQLISGGYSRLILSTAVAGEGDAIFGLVQDVRDTCAKYYADDYYLVGSAVTCYDMKTTTASDSLNVVLASIISIGLVLVLMFRSISIPILLLLSIEVSIWINLAVPYFAGSNIQYIGYLIISSIQLGATVDYTIILSRSYLEWRRTQKRMDAMRSAISHSAVTILTSATILIVCGVLIGVISTNGVIAELGVLIGRGTFISALNTFLFLPVLLVVFDGIIGHTTIGSHFYKPAPATDALQTIKAPQTIVSAHKEGTANKADSSSDLVLPDNDPSYEPPHA